MASYLQSGIFLNFLGFDFCLRRNDPIATRVYTEKLQKTIGTLNPVNWAYFWRHAIKYVESCGPKFNSLFSFFSVNYFFCFLFLKFILSQIFLVKSQKKIVRK